MVWTLLRWIVLSLYPMEMTVVGKWSFIEVAFLVMETGVCGRAIDFWDP